MYLLIQNMQLLNKILLALPNTLNFFSLDSNNNNGNSKTNERKKRALSQHLLSNKSRKY